VNLRRAFDYAQARAFDYAQAGPIWVLVVSGIIGFRIGLVGFPTWHICVETAQVVAGLVRYPVENPFYIYHTKLWSLVIQACAVLLKAGLSEITLSLALSGLLGMISFQALAMVTYAISRDVLVAIAAAVVVFASGVTDYGSIYPVWLVGTHHSYGAIGLSTFVLALGLIGAGFFRSGAFLLGIGPAIHPSVGIWVGSIAVAALAWTYVDMRDVVRPALKYFAAGCAATLVSAAVQFAFIYDVPSVDPAAVERTFSTFERLWDAHRRARIDFADTGAMFNRTVVPVALLWLIGFARDLPRPALFVLRAAAMAGIVSLAVVFLTRLPPDRMPMTLSILMPARLLNLDIVLVAPLLIGLVAAYRHRRSAQVLLVALLASLLLTRKSLLWRWIAERGSQPWNVRIDPVLLFEATALLILCIALWQATREPIDTRPRPGPSTSLRPGPSTSLRPGPRAPAASWLVRAATVSVLAIALLLGWRISGSRAIFRDRTNDPFYQAVAADRRGLTVTAGSFQLVQLYTRRPVLIDSGALDTMVYAPEGGPSTAQIVTDVYGINFYDPPRELRSSSLIPHDANRFTWSPSRFSAQRWRELRRTYNVSQVVTRSDYELDLPMVAEGDGLRLYRIPD
jgi:hypothetical protein